MPHSVFSQARRITANPATAPAPTPIWAVRPAAALLPWLDSEVDVEVEVAEFDSVPVLVLVLVADPEDPEEGATLETCTDEIGCPEVAHALLYSTKMAFVKF